MTVVVKHHLLQKEVLRHFYYRQKLTLTELSKLTHKSLPLITTTVNNLVDDGYVMEHDLARSTGGRRALTYTLNDKKKRYIVAVAVDQMVTQVVIYDLFNNIKMTAEAKELILAEQASLIDRFTGFLKDYIARSGIAKEQILGIGIGMPGFINAEQGVNHTFFKLKEDISLRKYLTREIGVPVFIDNDSSLIALAELRFGKGMDLKDVLVVNVGWGTGLGMIVNGALFRGQNGYAGEFSHIPLSDSNKICSCGKRGCLEVDTSLVVQLERAMADMKAGVSSSMEQAFRDTGLLTAQQYLQAANAGDPLAVKVLSDASFLIGKGISTLIHIMNPTMIVISGRGAIAGRMMMAPIQHAINEFCIPWLSEQTEIQVSKLAADSELLGAASLVIENCNFN